MNINTRVMRIVGVLLLVAAAVDAVALNWNRPDASVCQEVGGAGCGPVNYTLALVLACVGAGLIVVAGFFKIVVAGFFKRDKP